LKCGDADFVDFCGDGPFSLSGGTDDIASFAFFRTFSWGIAEIPFLIAVADFFKAVRDVAGADQFSNSMCRSSRWKREKRKPRLFILEY